MNNAGRNESVKQSREESGRRHAKMREGARKEADACLPAAREQDEKIHSIMD